MRVIGHQLGRAIILYPAEQLRPPGGVSISNIVEQTKERYGFQVVPNLSVPTTELNNSGLKFERGTLSVGTGAVNDFSIFTDGVVASAFTTDIAEEFLSDFFEWSRQEFKIRDFDIPPRKAYLSQLTVAFDVPISKAIRDFDAICGVVADALTSISGVHLPVNITGFDFAMDRLKLPHGIANAGFTIERRIQVPFENEMFFCEAPLPTKLHEETLRKMERLFG